jgi:hypothetical protein
MESPGRGDGIMKYLGSITKAPDPPGIDKEEWTSLILAHPILTPPEPRQIIKPFTKKPALVHPASTTAFVIVNGQKVGILDWGEDESNAITVSGEWPMPEAVILDIANRLGGRFERNVS